MMFYGFAIDQMQQQQKAMHHQMQYEQNVQQMKQQTGPVQPQAESQAQTQLQNNNKASKPQSLIITDKIKNPLLRKIILLAVKKLTPGNSPVLDQINQAIKQADHDRKEEAEKRSAKMNKIKVKTGEKIEKGINKIKDEVEEKSAKMNKIKIKTGEKIEKGIDKALDKVKKPTESKSPTLKKH